MLSSSVSETVIFWPIMSSEKRPASARHSSPRVGRLPAVSIGSLMPSVSMCAR